MFTTKIFSPGDVERKLVDTWLSSLNTKGQGMMVVGYTAFDGKLVITVKIWKRSESPQGSVRTTIDEIPEDPIVSCDEPLVASEYGS